MILLNKKKRKWKTNYY